MSYITFFQAVFRHRKILFFWYFCCFLIALFVYVFMAPVYVSTAKWYIKKESAESIFFDMQSAGSNKTISSLATTYLGLPSGNVNTIDAEILKSHEIVNAVIDQLDLKDNSGNPLSVKEFRKNLLVKPDKKFPFITIKYFGKSPQEAYDVVNTIEKVYLNANINAETRKAQKNKEFLKTQISLAKKYLNQASKKLLGFEKQSYIVNIEAETNQQQIRIASLKSTLANYEAEYKDIQARVADLKNKVKASSVSQAIDEVIISGDSNINELRHLLVKKNKDLIELKSRYTDKHFAVIEKKDEIEGLKKEILDRQKILIGKSISPAAIESIKSIKSDLVNNLAIYSSQEVALKARVDAVKDTLDSYLKEIQSLPVQKFTHNKLVFDIKLYRALFKRLSMAYEMANISEAFSNNTINVTKIVEPEKPFNPKYPNLLLNLSIALIVAIVGSFFNIVYVESKNDKIDNIKQLETLVSLRPLYRLNITDDKEKLYSYNNGFIDDQTLQESLEYIRQNLIFLNYSNNCKLVAFSGLNNPYGNACALLYTAISLAKLSKKICIVDMNFKETTLDNILDIDSSCDGLTNYLADRQGPIKNYVIDLKLFNTVHYLPSGIKIAEYSSLIESGFLQNALVALKADYDYVFINLPEMDDSSATLPVLKQVNGLLLTARTGKTSFKKVLQVEKSCKIYDINNVGFILMS